VTAAHIAGVAGGEDGGDVRGPKETSPETTHRLATVLHRPRADRVARFYITTAIDYANGDPHIGHAYEKIGADAIARFHRMAGDDVHFLIGMDEHGQKVAQTAQAGGITPQQQVDTVAERFLDTWRRLGISHDQFIRTTDPRHIAGVRALLDRIFTRNPDDFFERSYEGWYCVGCEAFKQESEIADGKCVLHPTRTLEWVKERNWFFRLSRYQDFLRRHIEENPDFIQPESRRNEVLGWLAQGLDDVSASRSRFAWGVPFPRPTSDGEKQTTYVWFDALPNYLTATGFPEAESERRWPASLHVIGKDITRFHVIIWPAMLQAAGLPLPKRVWAHGFVLLGGDRFSKSAGVKLDLDEAIDRYGPDAFRYFLLREVPFDADGNFSWERFEDRYTSDLANAWGNLVSRSAAMIEKYRGGVTPSGDRGPHHDADAASIVEYTSFLDGSNGYLLHEALAVVWRMVSRANEYVQSSAPWAVAKDASRSRQLDDILGSLSRQIARQCVLIWPFMPHKAESAWHIMGGIGNLSDAKLDRLADLDTAGWKVTKGEVLFPKPQKTL
jgi:methionyl-tRNA synthetase